MRDNDARQRSTRSTRHDWAVREVDVVKGRPKSLSHPSHAGTLSAEIP